MESLFEIERVEWVPATAEALDVHVYGRWRHAAPDGVELAVIDAGGEPRSFAPTAAGTDAAGAWHARFAVPVELRSRLSSRIGLRVGDREIALPAAAPGPVAGVAAPPPATVVEPTVLAQRRAAREGAADEALVRRAQAAEATASTLETQLDHLEARLRDALGERDRLAARLRAAEQRAEAERRVRGEAEDDRDALRAEVDRRVAELRARARAAEEHAEALGAEMDEIRREAAEAQHAAATARLAAERAASAGDASTQAELDRLGAEAAELARRLDGERAARSAAETQLARESARVAEAQRTVATLKAELARRTTVQTTVQTELQGLREALALVRARTEEGATSERAARDELRTAQAELAAARAAHDSAVAALREAERTLAAVRGEAAELRARLDDERRHRFESEATLKAELERERERWGTQVGEIEGRLHARIASERQAFEEQAAAIQELVVALRERLSSAGTELEERLAVAHRVRDDALAERDAARADTDRLKLELAGDLERAAQEREQLVARLTEAQVLVDRARADLELARDARSEIDARDAEIARLQAAAQDAEVRHAAIEALVADVLATAGSLRDGFDAQLAELHDRVEAELASLRGQLEEERTARIVAEEELAAERARGAAASAVTPSILDTMSRAELEATRRELAAAQEQLAAERRRSAETDELQAQASRLVADLEAANARLKVREEETDDAGVSEEPPVEESPAHQVLVDDAPVVVEEPQAVEAPVTPSPAADRPFGRPPSAPKAELATPGDVRPLATRFVRPAERTLTGWLTPAIATLADQNDALAAELLLELLPAQAGAVRDSLTYGLRIDGFATYRVTVGRDRAVAEPQTGLSGVDVEIAGPPAALAPLAGGGARRRMPGVRIEGRKRRLRKVLRSLRQPLDFARLADRGVRPAPELALAVLCAAVEPSWTAGHHFSVVYALAGAEALQVEVRDGRALLVRPAGPGGGEPPAATIFLRADALFPLVGRMHLPHDAEDVRVSGDGHAVALLHGWFDRAQGLPGN